jgi:surfeit locus 1 family protein
LTLSTHKAPGHPRPRAATTLVVLALLAVIIIGGFLALGTWQVQRRAWKLDLIARVDQRVHAAPVAAPDRSRWPQVNRADDEYRRVRVSGTFLNDKETLVQAVTELGGGFWVITPLRTTDGTTVLVNRGFVPSELRERSKRLATEPAGTSEVTGLLRISEPKGGFLNTNVPADDRWYSRDVDAIAAQRGLRDVAPYFIDADAGGRAAQVAVPESAVAASRDPQAWPQGGLTVISFSNSHLGYAITWYALALMATGGAVLVAREEWRRRRQPGDGGREQATGASTQRK